MQRLARSRAAKVLLALSVFLTVAGPPAPAAAATKYIEGDFKFEGWSNFSAFPCPTRCVGLIKGPWTGNLNGLYDGQPVTVNWVSAPQLEQYHMRFDTFDQLCDVADFGGYSTGYAEGWVDATASGLDQVQGTYGGELVNWIRLYSTYKWTRFGNSAAIDFETISIQIRTTSGRIADVVDRQQAGSADFVFTNAGDNPPPDLPPGCGKPITNVRGHVDGNAFLLPDA